MYIWGFPGGSVVKKKTNPPAKAGDVGSIPGSGRSPGETEWQPTAVFLTGKSHGQSGGYSPWSRQESDTTEQLKQQYVCLYIFNESESCSDVSDSLWPHGLYRLWNSPGQNTGVGSLSLLQGIFPTQGLKSGLPHCRQILYQLSHKDILKVLNRFIRHYLEIPVPGCYLTRNICWMPTRFSGHLRFIKEEWHLSVRFLSLHASRSPQTINSEHND